MDLQTISVIVFRELKNLPLEFDLAATVHCTYLLKHVVELLQGWSHSPMTTHAACVAVEVNVGHSVQGVMTKGADHRWTHHSVGLFILWRFIQRCIVGVIDVLPSSRPFSIHRNRWIQIYNYSNIQ